MKRALLGLCLALSMIVGSNARAQSDLKPIRLMYQTTTFGAPIIVALEKGWYEQALNKVGYTLKTSTATFGPPIVEALAAGQVDIGELGVAPHVVAVARGLPIKAVVTTNIAGESIMVSRDSPIKSVKQLAGKKVAIPGKGTMQDFIVRRALAANGMSPGDVMWVEMSPADMSTSLLRNQIDAAVLWEPWTARLVLQGARVLQSGQDVWPNHDNQLISVTGAAIRDHEPAVRAFVEQTVRGLQYIMDNPDESITITARHLGLDRDIVAKAWTMMIRRRSGAPNPESMQEFVNALREWGYVKRPVSSSDLIDTRFLGR
jgi:NitT/TauT family transport system substrate-binding protein